MTRNPDQGQPAVARWQRYEITGGNGRGATLDQIAAAMRAAGAKWGLDLRVRRRNAHGMRNQPQVVTFAAMNDREAQDLCAVACGILWSGDDSVFANLIAFPYGAGIKWVRKGNMTVRT